MMIAIFTDFGVQGPYLGQMRAVLLSQAPAVPVVDIFPDLPPFRVQAAAYLLPAYSQYLPDDSVCVCVVDPGVGTNRRALVVRVDSRWYVGPDNGLFSILIRRAAQVQVFEITWRPEQLSNSFHGRDLFAPVAAAIARGEQLPAEEIEVTRLLMPAWPEDLMQVVYLDSYGNAMTGLRSCSVSQDAILDVGETSCEFRPTFSEAEAGTPFWYENSNGLVEIALSNGHAAEALGLGVGSVFAYRLRDQVSD
jgi:S-adenosylmethionine hydrolase